MSDPTMELFFGGQWGWDGTRWRKLNLTWGYNDRLAEQKSTLNAVLGYNGLLHTVVPAGEVWVITEHVVVDCQTAVHITMRGNFGGVDVLIYDHGTPGVDVWHASPPMNIVLKAGDWIYAAFYGCAVGDDLYSNLFGYKMKVT